MKILNTIPLALLVLMPFCAPYLLGGVHLPILFGIIASVIIMIQKPSLEGWKHYSPLILYLWTIPFLFTLVSDIPCDIETSLLPNIFIVFSILLLSLNPSLDVKSLLKMYRYSAIVAIALFYVQEVSFFAMGTRPELYLNSDIFEFYYGGSMSIFGSSRASFDRSNSFFLEPAHFVQFIFPYFCSVVVNSLNEEKISKELLYVGLALLLTRSGNSYLLVLVLLSFIFLQYKGISIIKKVVVMFLIVISVVGFISFFPDNPIVQSIFGRMDEFSLDVNQYGHQSGFIRMYRGYFIFGAMNWINQIFGVAPGSFEYVSSVVNIWGIRYEGDYVNGIQGLLIRGGIVGTIIFIFSTIKPLYKESCESSKCILISLLGLFFVENMFLDYKMFEYVLLIFCFNKYFIDYKTEFTR